MIRIAQWLTQTIHHQPVSGRSSTGEPIYGVQVPRAARVEEETQTITDGDGTRTVQITTVFTEVQINREDRVWLPGANIADPEAAIIALADSKSRVPLRGTSVAFYETAF